MSTSCGPSSLTQELSEPQGPCMKPLSCPLTDEPELRKGQAWDVPGLAGHLNDCGTTGTSLPLSGPQRPHLYIRRDGIRSRRGCPAVTLCDMSPSRKADRELGVGRRPGCKRERSRPVFPCLLAPIGPFSRSSSEARLSPREEKECVFAEPRLCA